MDTLPPYLVAFEKDKKMTPPHSHPCAEEKGVTMASLLRKKRGDHITLTRMRSRRASPLLRRKRRGNCITPPVGRG